MYRPRDILPISDTQPFTHRASYTFLEKLRNLYDLFEKVEGDFGVTVEHITEIINTINNRVGSPTFGMGSFTLSAGEEGVPCRYACRSSAWAACC